MASIPSPRERYAEIASFLRSRRERLTPVAVGFPIGTRRRVKGLRREEVALLADVGVTWYTWLEQGRPIAVSDETLARIAAALRLNSSETEYLKKLVHPPTDQPHIWEMSVDDGIREIVENFDRGYAYLRNSRFDWLAWNQRFGRLQRLERASADSAAVEQNMLWKLFIDPDARKIYPHWREYGERLVAAFRAEYAEYIGDRDFEELIETLRSGSKEFNRLWESRDVLSPAQWVVTGPFDVRDPATGEVAPLKFESLHLTLPEYPGQVIAFGILR